MKKYLRKVQGSEETTIPDGYLKTSKFTTPSIKTDDQRKALEAFEIAVSQKYKQFDRMCDIQLYMTSDSVWSGVIDEYKEGYYINIQVTRASFVAFVTSDGSVIRKPRNLGEIIRQYEIEGVRGRVDWMSQGK